MFYDEFYTELNWTEIHTAQYTKLDTVMHTAYCNEHCTVYTVLQNEHATLYLLQYCILHAVLHTE